MAKMQVNILGLPPLRYLFEKAHRVTLPGFNGASLYDMGTHFFAEFRKLKLQERAAAVTYNFLMAMPPTFLFVFSLLPYLPFKHVDSTIFGILKLVTPNQNIYTNVHGVVADFMSKQHAGVLSYGVILVLFFSSNGVMGLMRCFDKSKDLYIKRTGLQRRWMAVKLTLILICLSIITLSVLIFQSKDLNPLIITRFHSLLAVKLLSGVILALLVFITISIIYTYGPSLCYKFKFVSTGSVCATIASVITTSVFFFLVNHFLNYNKLYGSIGTLIAFMVWVWLHTIIILLGYELNVSLLLGKLSRENNASGDE